MASSATAERSAPLLGSGQGQRWYHGGGRHGWGSSMLHFQISDLALERSQRWRQAASPPKQIPQGSSTRSCSGPRCPAPPIHITDIVCDPVGDRYPIYSCFGRGKRAADRDLLRNPKNPDSISEMIPVGRARSQSEAL